MTASRPFQVLVVVTSLAELEHRGLKEQARVIVGDELALAKRRDDALAATLRRP